MLYNPTTPAEAEAAAHLFNAQRTGQPGALPDATARPHTAAFLRRNRQACDYANQLAAGPNRGALDAEADYHETGNAYYTH